MKYSKEDKDYMLKLKKAFSDMSEIPFREIKMSKERFCQLSNTYDKIVNEDELKDFAFISTHPCVRDYYISSCGSLLVAEKLSLLMNKIESPESLVEPISSISEEIRKIWFLLKFDKIRFNMTHTGLIKIEVKPTRAVRLYLFIISLSLLVIAICFIIKTVK
jgi:hypothetical protein